MTETQKYMGYWDVSEKIPVILIDDDGSILRENYDYAYKLQGDENCDFLYFDSAVYTKIISLRSQHYIIKDGKITLP